MFIKQRFFLILYFLIAHLPTAFPTLLWHGGVKHCGVGPTTHRPSAGNRTLPGWKLIVCSTPAYLQRARESLSHPPLLPYAACRLA